MSNIRDIFNLNPNKNQFKIIINDYLDSRKIIDSSKREIKVEKNVKLDEIIFESMYFQPELMWQRLNQDKFPIQSLKMIELDCFYFNCNQSFKKFNLAYLDLMSQFELQKEFGDNLCFLAIKKVNLKKNQNHTQQVKFYSSNNILSTYLNTSRSNVAQTYTLLEQ